MFQSQLGLEEMETGPRRSEEEWRRLWLKGQKYAEHVQVNTQGGAAQRWGQENGNCYCVTSIKITSWLCQKQCRDTQPSKWGILKST